MSQKGLKKAENKKASPRENFFTSREIIKNGRGFLKAGDFSRKKL